MGDYPLKVDDDYPVSARNASGDVLVYDDLLREGERVGYGDGEGNVYPPYGRVVRRKDGLWVVPEKWWLAQSDRREA